MENVKCQLYSCSQEEAIFKEQTSHFLNQQSLRASCVYVDSESIQYCAQGSKYKVINR